MPEDSITADDLMHDNEWLFEALYDLAEAADEAGFPQLTAHLEIGMDVFVEEEKAMLSALSTFRSRRRLHPRSPAIFTGATFAQAHKTPSEIWEDMIRVHSTTSEAVTLTRAG